MADFGIGSEKHSTVYVTDGEFSGFQPDGSVFQLQCGRNPRALHHSTNDLQEALHHPKKEFFTN